MTTPSLDHTAAEDDAEEAEFTLIDAEAAYSGVSALVELLSACPPGQQVTGIFIRSLLVDVRMHLENVVDALSPVGAAELCHSGNVQ